jgi:hypothetical protein
MREITCTIPKCGDADCKVPAVKIKYNKKEASEI